MADDFGGGLSAPLDISAQAVNAMPDNSAPALDNSGTLPTKMPAPAVPQGNPIQQFGSSLANMLPGAHYTPPDPASSALDQSASLLQQRIDRAGKIATNPLAQLFAPEQVQAARDFVPKATEQLRTIAQQKAQVQAGRAQAQSMGLTPDEAPDQATQDDRIQVAQAKALKGDMRSFQGLQAVAPDHAAAIAPQVYATVAGHLNNAQLAFDSLAAMTNEGQYRAKVNQLRQDGTLADLESLGLKLPPSFDAFNSSKAAEGLALRNARIAINTTGQQLETRNTYQNMEEKEAGTYVNRNVTIYGDPTKGGTWARNAASNTAGQVFNGLATPDALGKGGVLGDPSQRKAIGEDFAAAVPKEDIEKYRQFNRTYQLATTDSKGNALPDGKINTNPNVQQGISEGLASMLRGGSGGANVGLLKIELGKRGWSQSAIDGLVTNYAGTMNSLFANADKPYLSQQTQKQIRDVMDTLKTYTDSSISDRAGNIARRAGALGFGADALGLGTGESSGAIGGAIEEGRQAQIARMRPNFQAIGGGDGVLQLGAQRPGASAIGMPPGSQPYNQLPGAQPLLTPVQQAGQGGAPPVSGGGAGPAPPSASPQGTGGGAGAPSAPSAPQPRMPPGSQPYNQGSGAGGGTGASPTGSGPSGGPASSPQPVTVAGQQVNVALPPGASPAYVTALQRIESGGERNPWTSGTQNSSASGAFQAIKGTWDQYKPAGAPARAADATPQQQADFLSNFTARNATALATAGLPVNDTSLYVAHNLGAAGGAKLMQADPTADARTVVGEAAAKNNPMFFKGKPAVATVLQRYSDAVNDSAPDDGPRKPPPYSPTALAAAGVTQDQRTGLLAYLTPKQREAMARHGVDTSAPGPTPEEQAGQWDRTRPALAGLAPAALGTVGALGGGAVGGPPGAVAGGAIGSGAGQVLKDYVQGNAQSPTKIAEQTALGGVLGVASAARPLLATAGRVVGTGAIEAGAEAARGGSGPDVVDAGLKGGAEALGGEAFGRALGMIGHKVFSLFSPDAKAGVQAAAKKYADSSEVLKTEPNRIPGAAGAAATPNPKYLAAEQAHGEAETVLKDAGLNPEEAAYAHKVSSEGVPLQEAQVSKPGALEKQSIGAGYDQLRTEVGAKGVGAVKAAPKLVDGPMAAVENKQVSAKHAELAQRTEMAITAPAANWQEKWQDLVDARSDLLQAERDALSSTATGKTQTAKDMRTLADTVRTQQAKTANYVFGPQQGPQVMQRLNALDVRYRRLMDATNGGDLSQAAGLKGAAGREADQKFRAFAAGDPTAVAAWDAMRSAVSKSPNYEKGIYNIMAVEKVPYLGKAVSYVRMLGSFNRWMQERAAGSPAKFSDILSGLPSGGGQTARDVGGAIAQRGAVQGDALAGVSP